MKLPHVLFGLSVTLNVAIVTVFALQPSLAPAAFRDVFQSGSATVEPPAGIVSKRATSLTNRKLWPMLASDDWPTLIARLRAAGFPASIIREMVRAEVNARYEPRLRAFTEPDPNTPFWKLPANSLRFGSGRWEEYSALQRERAKLLRDLLADPFFASEETSAAQRRQFGNLPQQTIDRLQRIEDDYAEMMSAIRTATKGVLLPEDREKLALLAREKQADLARELSSAQLADYELRSSPITRLLGSELGEFRPSETEFRALFKVQRTLNEKFPYTSGGTMGSTERRELEQQLNRELRTKLGEARYNDYLRETSEDYQQLRRLAQRENLPPDVAPRAFDLRNTVSQESLRIVNDTALTTEQKRAALATLAQNTRTQLLSTLGPAAGPTYVQAADRQWLSHIERGTAITFDGGPNRMIGSDNVLVSFGSGLRFHSIPPAQPAPAGPPSPRP